MTFTNEENLGQPIINQFSEIAQKCISWTFYWKAYIGQHGGAWWKCTEEEADEAKDGGAYQIK